MKQRNIERVTVRFTFVGYKNTKTGSYRHKTDLPLKNFKRFMILFIKIKYNIRLSMSTCTTQQEP